MTHLTKRKYVFDMQLGRRIEIIAETNFNINMYMVGLQTGGRVDMSVH